MRTHIALSIAALGSVFAWSTAQADGPPGKYALLIGISNYQFSGDGSSASVPRLEFPDDDVNELKSTLDKQGWTVKPLIDSEATHDQIMLTLATYNRVLNEDDTFLIYFAGHGVMNRRGRTYWLAYDTHPASLDYQGIRLTHLLEIVADLPPKTKIVLLDHCYAGNIEFLPRTAAIGDGARGLGAAPAGQRDWQITPPSVEAQAREILPTDVRADVGALHDQMVVIAAARGPAFEPAELHHGLFTYYLARALQTSEADTSGTPDAQLTVFELVDYLTREMQAYATQHGLAQSPLVPPSSADFIHFANQKLFSLPPNLAQLQSIKQNYLAQLAAWQQPDRAWVTSETISQSAEVLGRWIDAQQGRAILTGGEQRLVAALRSAVDGNVPPKEQTRAELFEAMAAGERRRPSQ